MYSALWKLLPGPLWVRIVIASAILVAVLALCVTVVFPFIDGLIGTQEVTVEQ